MIPNEPFSPPPSSVLHVPVPVGDPNATGLSRGELAAVYQQFREVRHSLNNALAVLMAHAEMGSRNPVHYEKLAKATLDRLPPLAEQLSALGAILAAKLKGEEPPHSKPPSSGVFQ